MLIIKSIHHQVFFLIVVGCCSQSVLGMKREFENDKTEQQKRPLEQNTTKNPLPKEHGTNNTQPNSDIFKNNIWGGHTKK